MPTTSVAQFEEFKEAFVERFSEIISASDREEFFLKAHEIFYNEIEGPGTVSILKCFSFAEKNVFRIQALSEGKRGRAQSLKRLASNSPDHPVEILTEVNVQNRLNAEKLAHKALAKLAYKGSKGTGRKLFKGDLDKLNKILSETLKEEEMEWHLEKRTKTLTETSDAVLFLMSSHDKDSWGLQKYIVVYLKKIKKIYFKFLYNEDSITGLSIDPVILEFYHVRF